MEMLTQSQAAAALSVSRATVVRLRLSNKLGWHRIGGRVRIAQTQIEEYVRRNQFGPATDGTAVE